MEPKTEDKMIEVRCQMEHKYVEAHPEMKNQYAEVKGKTLNKAAKTLKLIKTVSIGVNCKLLMDVQTVPAITRLKKSDDLNDSIDSISSF